MLRLLFLPFLAILFFSCERVLDENDPLIYQISEADSTRLMNEILDGILFEARESQSFWEDKEIHRVPICFTPREHFRIDINGRGEVKIGIEIAPTNITEKVFEYFMFNRLLTAEETAVTAMDPNSPGFEFPFYNGFGRDEIERKIKDTHEEFVEICKIEGVDSNLVNYYASKVDEWKVKLKTLELIGGESVDEVSYHAQVRVEYRKASAKSKKVVRDVALAFYQMRNYECWRYFNESYLSLYDRSKRKNQTLDHEKLEVLKLLHPANFYDNYRDPFEVEAPIPQENL